MADRRTRPSGNLDKPLIPRMSEEQLYGLLHASYSFKDTSFISRNIFRPYWKRMSSVCSGLNAAPTCLLTIGLLLNILHVLILTWWDPTFDPSATPRWLFSFSLLCFVVAFTFVGIDAAGEGRHYCLRNFRQFFQFFSGIFSPKRHKDKKFFFFKSLN
jgi:hypothetical protein